MILPPLVFPVEAFEVKCRQLKPIKGEGLSTFYLLVLSSMLLILIFKKITSYLNEDVYGTEPSLVFLWTLASNFFKAFSHL